MSYIGMEVEDDVKSKCLVVMIEIESEKFSMI